jgi:large subunit ribosomal protein L35e
MAIIRKKELKNMNKENMEKKLKDLKVELVKSKSQKIAQGTASKTKEIKRTIARLLTFINSNKK